MTRKRASLLKLSDGNIALGGPRSWDLARTQSRMKLGQDFFYEGTSIWNDRNGGHHFLENNDTDQVGGQDLGLDRLMRL